MNPITIKPDAQGKVRDIYDLGDTLLFVATDRISAFDYILEDEIPHKGQVLTQISCFWFELLEGVVENHLVSSDVNDLPEQFKEWSDYLNGRFMIVKKAQMIPIECIVRGYLTGSGFKDYQKTGSVCGIELPSGLQNSAKLPQTLFTPSTKAEIGDHDENISFERAVEIVGEKAATDIRDFRGISPKSFDGRGNYTLGITEQLIFPEIEYDKIDRTRGMDITFVTTAENNEQAKALLDALGFPFKK